MKKMVRKEDQFKSMIDGTIKVVKDYSKETGEVQFYDGTIAKSLGAYKFLGNDTPYPIIPKDRIAVYDGKLSIDGEDVEVGTLYIQKVLATRTDNILLLVRGLDEEFSDIFEYTISEDKFRKLYSEINAAKEVYADKDITVFKFSSDFPKIVEKYDEETGEVTEVNYVSVEDRLYFYSDDINVGTRSENIPIGELVIGENRQNDIILVFASDDDLVYSNDQNGYEFAYLDKRKTGKNLYELYISKGYYGHDDSEKEYLLSSVPFEFEFEINEEILDIKLTHDENRSLLVITENGIIYTNNEFSPRHAKGKDIVETALAFPYFVSLKPGHQHNEIVLANKYGETKTIKVTKTQDRGYITEIE